LDIVKPITLIAAQEAQQESRRTRRESPKVAPPKEDPSRDPARTKEGKQDMGRLIVVNSMNKMISQQSNIV
jgi:hypothetical protein